MLFSQLATYLAFFSVTYLATSLKLAKFSVTERTAAPADDLNVYLRKSMQCIWVPARRLSSHCILLEYLTFLLYQYVRS